MNPIRWMVTASVGSWLLVVGLSRGAVAIDVGVGMLGPLVAAAATWALVERTFRKNPARVTAVLLRAFAVKVVLFGLYVVLAIRGFSLRPVAFVTSFTCYFLALHAAEAFWLRRLFAAHTRDSR